MQQKELQDRQAEGKRFGMIARRHRRSAVSGMTANVADRNILYDGMVSDISTGGFRLQRKADDFAGSSMSYTVIVSVGRQRYRILAKPCWIRNDGATRNQEIGFRIIDAPWEWLELVMMSPYPIQKEYSQ
jgi:PilZ domain